ncbi:gamma carbonic anhydrase family protein [Bacteriovoracaceae bacterium]|nr:gamma carbonic anhydrase family protein [Bacteriovoracaceae bacterium]
MAIYQYLDFIPQISSDVFLAEEATVIGRVQLHEKVNVWHGAVIRGDVNKIEIGKGSNVQDVSCLHVTEENGLTIGMGVTIGHSVTLHACTIEDHCLIGMGSTVLDGAIIKKGSLVAAGSLVPPNKTYPEYSLIRGNPAKFVRELTPEEIKEYSHHYLSYVGYAQDFLNPEKYKKID